MNLTINEFQIYKTKVGLFPLKWSEPSPLGNNGLIEAGSHCWLDQVTPEGWANFHLFGDDCVGLYIRIPTELVDDQIEEVRNEDGSLAMVEHTDRIA